MGTARVEKVLVATHLDERDELLRRLQEEGILHISEPEKGEEKPREKVKLNLQDTELKQTLIGLNQSISFLSGYTEKRGGGLFAAKPSLPADEFRRRVEELGLEQRLGFIGKLSETASRLDDEERRIRSELETLSPWVNLKHPPNEYINLNRTDARFVFISSKEEAGNLRKALKSLSANLESVKAQDETEYAVILFPRDEEEAIEDVLKATGVKTVQLAGFKKTTPEEIEQRKKHLAEIDKERKELTSQALKMADELSGLQTALDLYENEGLVHEQHEKMLATEKAALIEGWVRRSDRKRLERIVAEFEASEVRSLKPKKGELPPVALRNPPWIKPFELILNMYGTPDGREVDPTPLVAPFFALFFALCLTDAGYGIVIAAATAWLIWGRKIRNDLLWILFYGGILTIFTGAAMGSWFGNMPDMLQIPWLISFRDALTWFDPLKNPMPFFYISLGIGYFQMMFGIAVEVIDGLRTKDYGSALFETLPWFIIYLGVPLMILTSKVMPLLPKFLFTPLLILILASLAVFIVLSERPDRTSVTSAILLWAAVTAALLAAAKGMGAIPFPGIVLKALLLGTLGALWLYTLFKGLSEKTLRPLGIVFGALALASIILYVAKVIPSNLFLAAVFVLNLIFTLSVLKGWGGRIIWGLYGVYSNTTGVLGIILSYVRLMALGMVTAGIAMAFNQIAWMLGGIPVVSIILILAVLLIGHVYNILISSLSGFVHTLRLQYVEYFPRFFTGGGARFEPFKLKTQYVNVTRRT